MCPIERWRAAGPLSEQAQDQLSRIVIGSEGESEQWSSFEQMLTPEQRQAFRALQRHLSGGSNPRA